MPQPEPEPVPSPRIPAALAPLLAREQQNVLIIKPSSLGDVVHTLPAVALLKQRRPGWKLRWLVNPEWAPLLEDNPYLEGVIPFPRGQFRGLQGLPRLWAWLRVLRAAGHGFDGVVDFQGLSRSALIAKWLRPGWIAGLGDAREGAGLFYGLKVPVSRHEHSVRRYLRLSAALSGRPELIQVPGEQLPFPLPAGQPLPAFPPAPPYLVLHPFSRGADKSLAPDQVADLCRWLAPWRVVVAGRCAPELMLSLALPSNAVNLLNETTLGQFIHLLRGATFTISVDSGPMHIAAALGPRVLGIHTWSNPASVGPLHPAAWVWKGGEILSAAACQDPRYQCPPRHGTPSAHELQDLAHFTLNLVSG